MNDKRYEFCIKAPKWQKVIFFVLFGMGVIGSITLFILWLIFRFDWGILAGVLLIFGIEFLLSSVGLLAWYREEFLFKDGVFTYTKPFGKKQSANLADIARVELSIAYAFPRVTFIGKDGRALARFSDDGTVLKSNCFTAALLHYDIPIVRK